MTVQAALALLYAHEINAGLSSFWDGGFDVWIGDRLNGMKARTSFDVEQLALAGPWFINEARRLYPLFADAVPEAVLA